MGGCHSVNWQTCCSNKKQRIVSKINFLVKQRRFTIYLVKWSSRRNLVLWIGQGNGSENVRHCRICGVTRFGPTRSYGNEPAASWSRWAGRILGRERPPRDVPAEHRRSGRSCSSACAVFF